MARSIVLEVRQAVIAGIAADLSAAEGFDGVSVTYGWQGGSDDARREQVFTNNARGTHDPAALKAGRNFRNEQMTFEIVIVVLGVGMKPEECDARALDIGQVVEEFVADNKSNELGVTGLNWMRMDDFALTTRIGTGADTHGSVSEITYTVRYDARLT